MEKQNLENQLSSHLNLFNNSKQYESFNNCEEIKSRMIVIGEVTSIQVFMQMNYEFLDNNNFINSNNKKNLLSRTSSFYNQHEIDEEEEEDFIADINNSTSSSTSQSNASIVNAFRSFKLLKDRLNKNLNVLIDHSYLKPFCDLITNKDISGRVTALALASLLKFLNYGFIDYTENQGSAQLLSETVRNVRFMSTNISSDEVVLMRILILIRELVTRGFNLINNQTLSGMIETCFRIIFESNLSELLRKNAEHTLVDIVRTLFMRLDEFQEDENSLLSLKQNKLDSSTSHLEIESFSDLKQNNLEKKLTDSMKNINLKNEPSEKIKEDSLKNNSQKCYDIKCIYNLFCKLAIIVNPLEETGNKLITNQVGLNLLVVVFETAVLPIGQKLTFLEIVKNKLCWSLINILSPDKPITLFSHGLRLCSLIFIPLRIHLKYQFQEVLIKMIEVLSSKTASLEYKEITIDYLNSFFLQIPFLPHELFINYDCDPYALNILEDILELLSKNCYLNSQLTNIQNTSGIDLPVLNYVKKMSFNSLLLVLKSLQQAEVSEDFVIMPYLNDHQKYLKSKSQAQFENKIQNEYQTYIDNNDDQFNEDNYNSFIEFPLTLKQISTLKERKKLLWQASEKFNAKTSKGISFLRENNLIENDEDLVKFLRENTRLDKKELGDYLSNRKNQEILEKFVKSFDFINLRLDKALRLYLESFRLPGEAPLISLLLEQFATYWFDVNKKPFADSDAAFALSYAIIMLNTDQHNSNVRQSMTCEDFIKNLRSVNGGKDFDQKMLESIYYTIKDDKIITPAEQQGVIREKYMWKCMLTKSQTPFGIYFYATKPERKNSDTNLDFTRSNPELNQFSQIKFLNASIFEIIWGPSISALTFLFDKININKKSGLFKKILNQGFTSCAFLCARYGHLDDLIVSLCKFTINSAGGPMNPLYYTKSQEAALCLFNITKEYANEIRDSWKNIVEIILNWFRGKFLDDMFEVEDFALNSKLIKLNRKINIKNNRKNVAENSSNIFTSFYQFFSGNDNRNENDQSSFFTNSKNYEDQAEKLKFIYEQPLAIIRDSKFFHLDSLVELIKAIININVEFVDELGDDVEVFKLELLLQIIFLNRDRVAILWPQISEYLLKLLKSCETSEFLAERTISTVFRLAIRFICRPEISNSQIFNLLTKTMKTISSKQFQKYQTALALYSFITHSHCYLSTTEEWKSIDEIILYIGINYKTKSFVPLNMDITLSSTEDINIQSDQENLSCEFEKISSVVQQQRGYTSDSELNLSRSNETNKQNSNSQLTSQSFKNLNSHLQLMTDKSIGTKKNSCFKIRDISAYEKCIEILNLIVKEVIPKYIQLNLENSITDENLTGILESCIDTLRKFVEASIKINKFSSNNHTIAKRTNSLKQVDMPRRHEHDLRSNFSRNSVNQVTLNNLSESETELLVDENNSNQDYINKLNEKRAFHEKLNITTETCAVNLLELMHFLHLNVYFINSGSGGIENKDQENKKTFTFDYLWTHIWCPLLQCIALLCCDSRKKVRINAYTFLERQLLNPELKSLSSIQWECCFNKVLFPLLSELLEQVNQKESIDMDETRERVTSLLSKVYLQHLNLLYSLPTFTTLWLTILDFMDKYIKAEMKTELVKEAIPQRLKNMLQVMVNANCLSESLSVVTWERINLFLPDFKNEIFESSQHQFINNQTSTNNQINNTNQSNSIEQTSQVLETITQHQPQVVQNQNTVEMPVQSIQQNISSSPQNYLNTYEDKESNKNQMFVNFNNSNYNPYNCMIDYSLHGSYNVVNSPTNISQQNSNLVNPMNQLSCSGQTNVHGFNPSDPYCNQIENNSYLNYNTINYDTYAEEQSSNKLTQPDQYTLNNLNNADNFSQPSCITVDASLNEQKNQTNTQQQYQHLHTADSLNQIPVTQNFNEVIPMPVLQSSANMPEETYHQLQQQKNFVTFSYNTGNYPWPTPK